MPDAYTSNKLGLIEPAAGAYSGTWDNPLYANWQTIDAALGGTTTITLASSNVTLTIPTFPTNANPPAVATSAQNLRVLLQGTLSANVFVNLPASVPGMWLIDNQTAVNAFTVTVKTAAGGSTGITPPRGYLSYIFSDGTNVRYADQGNVIANVPQGVPAGIISAFAGPYPPFGYLFCDGTVLSQTTYAALFAAISTTWNTGGEGAGNFRLPDLRNMFLRGFGSQAVGVYEGDTFGSHSHGVNDPSHSHTFSSDVNIGSLSSSYYTPNGISNFRLGYTNPASTGISIQNSGGTETRPVNKRVLYVIKAF